MIPIDLKVPIEQMPAEVQNSLSLFLPEMALVITFVVAIILDLIFKKSKNIAGWTAIIGFFITGYFLLICQQCNAVTGIFSNIVAVDPFARFFKLLILLTAIIVSFMSFYSKELYEEDRRLGEYFTIIIGMTFGMFLLASATNLVMMYLAIETMSMSSYVLAGFTKEVKRASEASLKYVIYGAASSGIMIYGISILFGLTGSFNFMEINQALMAGEVSVFALVMAGFMILAGIGFKISMVPFHFWTPDVYEGAPITITAFLSVASKAAGFAILMRFVKTAFVDTSLYENTDFWTTIHQIDWSFILAVFAVLTMTLGNITAIWQKNVKRLLAYSSIAHAGYLLMGVVVMTSAGYIAVMIYFFIYMIMNLGAFYITMLIANKTGSENIDDYYGLGYRAPVLSATMVLFLISLVGLPPTAGFIGKLFLFIAVLEAGDHWIWLAVVGILNSVVSLFYYMNIVRNMYLRDVDSKKPELNYQMGAYVIAYLLAIPTLLFGLYYTPIADWAKNSVVMFLGK